MEKKQKVWLITGATAGIGKALAQRVYEQHDIVVVTTRRNEGVQELQQWFPERSLPLVMDLNNSSSIQEGVRKILSAFGRIDTLVNNAGYGIAGAIEELSEAEAREQMETNFFGVFNLTKAVLPGMRERRSGHIIQISSSLAIGAKPGMGLYAASKFALEGLSEALAMEVSSHNIHVTMVQPGPVRTEFFGRSIKSAQSQIDAYKEITGFARSAGDQVHGRQEGDPLKIANAIIQIASLEQPSLRLPLTPDTLSFMQRKIDSLKADLERWSDVAGATSFDS